MLNVVNKFMSKKSSKKKRKDLPCCNPDSDSDVIIEWVDLQSRRFEKSKVEEVLNEGMLQSARQEG